MKINENKIKNKIKLTKTLGLIVCAVRTRYKFSVFLGVWKPSFKIIFLGSSIIESTRNNHNDLVWESERLVEFLRVGQHFFVHFPRVFWLGDAKLFNFFELMDSEDST